VARLLKDAFKLKPLAVRAVRVAKEKEKAT
jgi:hypothetical protein